MGGRGRAGGRVGVPGAGVAEAKEEEEEIRTINRRATGTCRTGFFGEGFDTPLGALRRRGNRRGVVTLVTGASVFGKP